MWYRLRSNRRYLSALNAKKAASVTMLQRSPTYVISRPSEDWFANGLRKLLPHSWAYALTRLRNTRFQELLYNRHAKDPKKLKDHP